MVTMVMVTDTATRLCFTMADTTAPRTSKMMKVLCAMFSPNTQFLGTAMTRPPSVRCFTENCDYADMTGLHWKGVQEIVQRHTDLFQNRLKTAVRRLTGAEVSFSTPDVAVVHATWDVIR